jgi:hypothetical protein
MNEGLFDIIKSVWAKFKALFNSILDKATDNLFPGDEVEVTIPLSINLDEAVSGNLKRFWCAS